MYRVCHTDPAATEFENVWTLTDTRSWHNNVPRTGSPTFDCVQSGRVAQLAERSQLPRTASRSTRPRGAACRPRAAPSACSPPGPTATTPVRRRYQECVHGQATALSPSSGKGKVGNRLSHYASPLPRSHPPLALSWSAVRGTAVPALGGATRAKGRRRGGSVSAPQDSEAT